ncbi:MAG TPA: hypothetical protein VE988_06235 [Gemmataceae bacterium]|nr:hypothetical protein [Gemmataceae bacterium]
MNRSAMLIAFLLVLVGGGCQRRSQPPASDDKTGQKVDELSRKIDELKAILAELKQGRQGAEQECRNWLNANFIPGKTTLTDVESLMGNKYLNLDRPDRDDVLTVQFSLDDVAGRKIILDFTRLQKSESSPIDGIFNAKNDPRVLEKGFEFGFQICGFCPHILVDADGWRLDGKMLAGAIGERRESVDTLVLPRAHARQGKVQVKLANWAPEIEILDQVELGVVAAQPGEQLDFDGNGGAYLWRENQTIPCSAPKTRGGRDYWRLKLASGQGSAVLVLELRNTEMFQDTAKQSYLRDEEPQADLIVEGLNNIAIKPIGTKFFRRVVIPVSAGVSEIRLSSPAGMWWVRRAWEGSGKSASMCWVSPSQNNSAAAALQNRDGRRLRLMPHEETEMSFCLPHDQKQNNNLKLALRLCGYYEFLQTP